MAFRGIVNTLNAGFFLFEVPSSSRNRNAEAMGRCGDCAHDPDPFRALLADHSDGNKAG